MKYDNELFNLSIEAYNMVKPLNNNINKEIKRKQDKLLKLLFIKFQEQLKSKKDIGEGILKVKFKSRLENDFNDGYQEIDELVKNNTFYSFASEYCIYISDIEDKCDESHSAYYEVIWDYKTYFKQLKTHQTGKKVINERKKQERQSKIELCKISGHNFEEWKEKKWTTLEEYGPSGIEYLLTGCKTDTIEVKHIKWIRRCKNCGYVQTRNKKPAEIEAPEIEEEIKKLQRKLDKIKKERE